MRMKLIAPAVAALALTLPMAVQAAPPSDARPLSEIIASIEASGDVAWFDEIEWEDDGYWEIEYYRPDGAKVEVRINPVTGEPRR
ncbi:MAG: PepSY domain-containing protein [Hyphomicrobiaceae bacterium]